MTGYTISLGYNTGFNGNCWESLKEIVNGITREELKAEFLAYEPSEYPDAVVNIDEFVDSHFTRTDGTLNIYDDDTAIHMNASGGGAARDIKEGLRRAMCRLVLRKAHKQKLEICINVA